MKWCWTQKRETRGEFFYRWGRKIHLILPPFFARETCIFIISIFNEYYQIQHCGCDEHTPRHRSPGRSALAFEWWHEVLQNAYHADSRKDWSSMLTPRIPRSRTLWLWEERHINPSPSDSVLLAIVWTSSFPVIRNFASNFPLLLSSSLESFSSLIMFMSVSRLMRLSSSLKVRKLSRRLRTFLSLVVARSISRLFTFQSARRCISLLLRTKRNVILSSPKFPPSSPKR